MTNVVCKRNYTPSGSSKLRVLVVAGHPDTKKSFNAAIRAKVEQALKDPGHHVRVINVSDGTFDPILSQAEHREIYSNSGKSADLKEHISAVSWADAVVYVYPTWWSSVPAGLKGWIDRVLVPGVAYAPPQGDEESIRPLLKYKKTGVITTTGGPAGQEPDLGVLLLTEVIPNGCYVNKSDILVCKLHSVLPGAPHLSDQLELVYSEMRNF